MAIKDVKNYYYTMQAQYLTMKADLADFEEALKNGYIAEEQMQAAIDEVYSLQLNYDRLTYIMYLLEQPTRKEKAAKYNKQNKALLTAFKNAKADKESVEVENESALKSFRQALKQLAEKQ